jgi:hypothetical protein
MMNEKKKKILSLARKGMDVAKWIKAVDCGFTMCGFNFRRSPITLFRIPKFFYYYFFIKME